MRHGHNMAQIPIKALMTTLLIGVYNPTFDSEHAGESALTKPKHWWRVKGSMLPSKNYTQLTACQWKIYRSTAGG